MNYYILVTENDNGKEYIKTCALNKETAINNFSLCYNAPITAVKKVYSIPLMFFSWDSKYLIKKNLTNPLN